MAAATTAWRAGLTVVGLQFVCYFVGLVSAATNRKVWLALQLPDVLVVRKVDYNHYSEEPLVFLLVALVLLVAQQALFARQMPVALLALFPFVLLSGAVGVSLQEFMLQISGVRSMDVMAFAARAPSPVATALRALDAAGAPVALQKTAAVCWQGFVEGGIYFFQPFCASSWLHTNHPWRIRAVALFVGWQALFRTGVCLVHGWPKPVIIGGVPVVGKRAMLSTLAFRLPQLVCIAVLLRTPRWRRCWLPMAALQFGFLSYYFWMLRFMGRSYLELQPGGVETIGLDDAVEALPLWVEFLCMTIRALEPVMGGAACMVNALVGLELMSPRTRDAGCEKEEGTCAATEKPKTS